MYKKIIEVLKELGFKYHEYELDGYKYGCSEVIDIESPVEVTIYYNDNTALVCDENETVKIETFGSRIQLAYVLGFLARKGF